MRMGFLVASICIAMSACATSPAKPNLCFSDELPVNPTHAGEIKAVKYVRRHVGANCRAANVECNLQLRRRDNKIEVVVYRAMISGDPPECTRLEGGFETYVFSTKGEYMQVVLGL